MATKDYSFEGTVDRLTDLLQAKINAADPNATAWRDMFSASTGRVFVELMASGVEHLGYYLERRTSENFLTTAELRSSVNNLAAGLGYLPKRKTAATGTGKIIFNTPVTESLQVGRGTALDTSLAITTFSDISIPIGAVAVGTGDGILVQFSATLAKMEAGSLKILIDGDESATDDGEGVITGTGITGTINYDTGAVSLTFTSAPANAAVISSTYKQVVTFTAVQGVYVSFETTGLTENVDYVEAPDIYNNISETHVRVNAHDIVEGESFEYSRATSGFPQQRAEDRVYWPLYSYRDRLRTYFGDGDFGRNPFQDGTKVVVEYITTDGASGNSSSEVTGAFVGAPTNSQSEVTPSSDYTVKITQLSGGVNEEAIEKTRLNSVSLHATGLRAVTKKDFKYFIETQPGVDKSSVWTEEDVSPPNLRMRNVVKFTAVDLNGEDIDQAIASGTADIVEHPASEYRKLVDATKDFTALGVVEDDHVVIFKKYYRVNSVLSATELELKTGPDAALDDEFYHITRVDPVASKTIIDALEAYRTITVGMEYEPPIIVPVDLTVQIEVLSGHSPANVISAVQTTLLAKYHPTFFEFGAELAKSDFWETVMITEGVKTATISWDVDGVSESSDYWNPSSGLANKHLAQLNTVAVSEKS